jgi:hypothetical protein
VAGVLIHEPHAAQADEVETPTMGLLIIEGFFEVATQVLYI